MAQERCGWIVCAWQASGIVPAIERGRLKLSAGMAVRFAAALGVGVDELLARANGVVKNGREPSRKVLRRLDQIEVVRGELPGWWLKGKSRPRVGSAGAAKRTVDCNH